QCADAIKDGSLRIILANFEVEPLPVHLLHAGRGALPSKMRVFLDFAAGRPRAGLSSLLSFRVPIPSGFSPPCGCSRRVNSRLSRHREESVVARKRLWEFGPLWTCRRSSPRRPLHGVRPQRRDAAASDLEKSQCRRGAVSGRSNELTWTKSASDQTSCP